MDNIKKGKSWIIDLDNYTAYHLKDIMETIVKTQNGGKILCGNADREIAKKIIAMLGHVPIPNVYDPHFYYDKDSLR
jgi:hypothetical protein